MVRLKGGTFSTPVTSITFQFQHGTIKRPGELQIKCEENRFQFQHGTIKSANIPVKSYSGMLISIPTWYD